MSPSKWRKSVKARFVPTLELLEKREVLVLPCALASSKSPSWKIKPPSL